MQRKSFEDMACSVAHSLEVVGEWWTLLIVVLPLLGTLIYIVTRPEMSDPRMRPAI